jgi:hypothetical protein
MSKKRKEKKISKIYKIMYQAQKESFKEKKRRVFTVAEF